MANLCLSLFGVLILLTLESSYGQQQCYNVNSGVDYSPGSNDILSRDGFDLGGCCDLCKTTPGCKAFVWSKGGLTCWLKSTNTPKTVNEDRISGFPEPLPISGGQQCSGSVLPGIEYSPGANSIFSPRNGFDVERCCDLCKVTPGCKAFVWSKSLRTCWVKSSAESQVVNADRISGVPAASVPQQECSAINSGLDYSPGSHDVAWIRNVDLASCCTLCNKNPACKAFVWSKSQSECWLKDADFPRVQSEDRISGLRASESSLPPVPVPPASPACNLGTPEQIEEAFRLRLCYHACLEGNDKTCECCKNEGFSGGKCINGFAYCYE